LYSCQYVWINVKGDSYESDLEVAWQGNDMR
jgi:hypothetical protein